MRSIFLFRIICHAALFACLCGGCRSVQSGDNESLKQVDIAPVEDTMPKPDRLDMARRLIARGYHDVALSQLREAAQEDRRNPEIPYLSGICHREEGRLRDAEKCFRRAIKIDNGFAPAHDGLGVTLYTLDQRKDARKAFDKAVFCNPGRADFQNNLGYCCLEAGALVEAERHFRKSIELDQGFVIARHNLAACLVRGGREEEAFRELCRDMTPAQAYNDIGVTYERIGDLERAMTYYKRAFDDPQSLKEAGANVLRIESLLSKQGVAK